MMEHLLWAVGSVLVFEGLVLALAPLRLAEALALLARLRPPVRLERAGTGRGGVVAGAGLFWLICGLKQLSHELDADHQGLNCTDARLSASVQPWFVARPNPRLIKPNK